jgi:type III secretion protein J
VASLLGGVAWRPVLLLVLVLGITACSQPLYTQLTEQEANEVVAVLNRAGLSATKAAKGDKAWGVDINPTDMAQAMEALTVAGLPRQRYATLGELFKREGLVATPTEERVRFIHGVSQELSNTLSAIDGVVEARVHLVIPQNDPLADKPRASSASVFVKHRSDVDLHPTLPAIKSLVLRSVEGLTLDTVHVSLFPSEKSRLALVKPAKAHGMSGLGSWGTWLPWLLGAVGLVTAAWFGYSRRDLLMGPRKATSMGMVALDSLETPGR